MEKDIHLLSWEDIFTTNYELHKITGIDLP